MKKCIVYISSLDNNLQYFCLNNSLKSLFNKNNEIPVYILTLSNNLNEFNIPYNVNFINIKKYVDKYISDKILNFKGRFTCFSFFKVLIPFIEELKCFDKILYLDTDTIILKNISDVFKIETSKIFTLFYSDEHTRQNNIKYYGWIDDIKSKYLDIYKKIGLNNYFYLDYIYNIGVILFNNRYENIKDYESKLINVIENYKEEYFICAEQEFVNWFFDYNVSKLNFNSNKIKENLYIYHYWSIKKKDIFKNINNIMQKYIKKISDYKYNFEIEITLRCNMLCNCCNRLCNYKKIWKDSDITTDEFDSILNQISKYKDNIGRISIMGGEPSLNKKIEDICKKLNDFDCTCIKQIMTNNTNKHIYDIVKKYYNINVCVDNYDDVHDFNILKDRKNKKHINFLISPQEKKLEQYNPKSCYIYRGCGISICKIKGHIKYYWCGPAKSLCILTGKENYLCDSLDELLLKDKKEMFENICCNCMFNCKKPIYCLENNEISKCFLEKINELK